MDQSLSSANEHGSPCRFSCHCIPSSRLDAFPSDVCIPKAIDNDEQRNIAQELKAHVISRGLVTCLRLITLESSWTLKACREM